MLVCRSIAILAAATTMPLAVWADAPLPENVLTLSASASVEAPNDLMSLTFNTTRSGANAASVQSLLKQALDAALTEARGVAKAGQVDVQTGNFSISPHTNRQNVIDGWQGSAQLVVSGRDMAAIAELSGRITTLSIGRVEYSLSRESREKTEAQVGAQAVSAFRAKAADYARDFGYVGYTIREVNVRADSGYAPRPMMFAAAKVASPTDDALPVEAGKGTVSVTVSGSVQMTR